MNDITIKKFKCHKSKMSYDFLFDENINVYSLPNGKLITFARK